MLSAFYMTKNIQIIIYYLIYMVKIPKWPPMNQDGDQKNANHIFLK